ncbi:MAG: ABC transporter permease subunit [Propionibacteriales bacterium]|nr:ABC transporter permease subunit [Propionibacteriales bacterium]
MVSRAGSLPRYMLQRLLLVIPMLFILLTLVFLIMRVAPGDPVSATVGGQLREEELERRRAALGFDRPLIVQYLDYLGDVARLDFGTTITDDQPIMNIVKENGGATLTLTVAAFAVALFLGVVFGLIAGRFRDSAGDVVIRLLGIATYAAPVFYTGILVKMLFAGNLGWLPPNRATSGFTESDVDEHTHILLVDALWQGETEAVVDILEHLVLPAATLGIFICGIFVRLIRVNVLQTLQADYVEAARARGVRESKVMRSHAFRNALVPVVTIIGLQVALLLSGAVLTERTFEWPGIGSELVRYITLRDYTAVQGIITMFAVVVVVISILVDIVIAIIDPRVRY